MLVELFRTDDPQLTMVRTLNFLFHHGTKPIRSQQKLNSRPWIFIFSTTVPPNQPCNHERKPPTHQHTLLLAFGDMVFSYLVMSINTHICVYIEDTQPWSIKRLCLRQLCPLSAHVSALRVLRWWNSGCWARRVQHMHCKLISTTPFSVNQFPTLPHKMLIIPSTTIINQLPALTMC